MAKIKTEEEKVEKTAKVTEAVVLWHGNTRVYTKEEHGDDFVKLAKEFADKKGGVVA